MTPVVFLDRDGVLNRALVRDGVPHPPASAADLEILPGVTEALERLRRAGYRLVVVTNQPDVARGVTTRGAVESIHERLTQALPIDAIRVCYHDDADGCACRKPKPGMLLAEVDADFGASIMIGDRWRDIEAGRAAGCATVLVDWGLAEPLRHEPDARVGTLSEAADWILSRRGHQP